MSTAVKILIAEHSLSDIDLIKRELKKDGINYVSEVVETESTYIQALDTFVPDIILCDYNFPAFDGVTAFNLKKQLAPDAAFIFVTGTVGEENAVELIKKGANDYVLKDKLFTLSHKIKRALEEEEKKKDQKILSEKLEKAKHLYAFISQVNQNIVRVKDQETLFRNSCRLAIEFGNFQMAWIGLFDAEKDSISLVEQSGIAKEDLASFVNIPCTPGCAEFSVIQTGQYFACNDIQSDLNVPEGLKSFAKTRGINSCMMLPIKKSGSAIGTFNLYSSEFNFSGASEVRLLREVTADISFALDAFEKAKKYEEATQQILKQEQKFRHTLDNMLEGIQIHDFNFRYLYVNDVLVKSSGYTREELIGHTLMDKYPGIEQSDLYKCLHLCMTERVSQHLETTFTFPDGTQTDFELSIEPIPEGITILSIDRTEQNKAKAKLLKVNRLFAFISAINQSIVHVKDEQELLDNACRIAVDVGGYKMAWIDLITDQNSKTNIVSLGASKNLTNAVKQFSGVNYTDPAFNGTPTGIVLSTGRLGVINDLQNNPAMEAWKKEITENGIHAGMALPITKFGKLVGIFGFYSAVENHFDDKETALLKEAAEDISFALENFDKDRQHRVAEENLAQSESRLKEAQAISHIGNWEHDFASNVHSWSDELYVIFGISKNETQPSKELFLSFVHPEDADEIKTKVDEAFRSLKATSYNFRFIRQDGAVRYGYTERRFEFDQSGKPLRLLGVVQDITERRLIEQEREKMIASIVQHSKNLEQFTSIVSHNLRAPVANILGLSNMLKSEISKEQREMAQKHLFSSTVQLDEMLTDLNNILQVKSDINEYKETVNFQELVNVIQSSIPALIETENVVIHTDFDKIDQVTTIKSYLYSIFYNLIANSIKYKRNNVPPVIRIRSEVNKNKLTLFFADNGIGIDLTRNGAKIFGLYKRFHMHTEGKGLGLFMVKTQVETLGGTIDVVSTPGEGTEFTIELPL